MKGSSSEEEEGLVEPAREEAKLDRAERSEVEEAAEEDIDEE